MSNIAVTPLVGVWIEMSVSYRPYILKLVTPLVGVWIEMEITYELDVMQTCHSPRGSVD